jgi:hypothetical protein
MEYIQIIRRLGDVRYSPVFYRYVSIFTLLLIALVTTASTTSVKSFVNTRTDIRDNSVWVKTFDNNASYIPNNIVTQSIKAFGSTRYINNYSQQLPSNLINQTIRLDPSPSVNVTDAPIDTSIIENITPIPANPIRTNFLSFPTFNINAPIVYSDEVSSKDIIDPLNPCSQSSMRTPLQQLVRKGLVHLFPSPKPGELYNSQANSYYDKDDKKTYYIGNSYIVGHSSECISHEFSKVFAPLQDRSPINDTFIIYDEVGRKLVFRVFEAKEIISAQEGAAEAFKIFEGKRVVTLQTSKFYSKTKINRWIIRGELI